MQAVNTPPWFKELLEDHQPPCISVYLPLPRTAAPGNLAPVEFRDTIDKLRERLGGHRGYGADRQEAAVKRLEDLMQNPNLWEGDRDALAFFVSPDHGHVVEIRRPVDLMVEVADSFHVKPLIRALQQARRFHVLCVSPHRVRLFEADYPKIREIELRNVPQSTDDPIATQANTTTGIRAVPVSSPSPGNVGVQRFFQLVDQAVWENYSRREQLPMIVCADVQHLSDFINMSRNDYIMKQGIALNPQAATPDRLLEEAWKIFQPEFEQHIQSLKDAYHAAKARQLGSDEIPEVAEAAASGRVGTLLVDSDAKVPGILHRASGMIEQAALSNPRADDVLDDLAEMVLKMDGQVFVLPHDQMPTDHGLAAVYRY